MKDYPHQFSGGMRQRVVGATAIACEPQLLIADEATTALDATIQAQYLELLRGLQTDLNLALLFITHDFGIVAKMCDDVAVMYAGRIVEYADVRETFNRPAHPYTRALLEAVPKVDGRVNRLYAIPGSPATGWTREPGVPFCVAVRLRLRALHPGEAAAGHGQGGAHFGVLARRGGVRQKHRLAGQRTLGRRESDASSPQIFNAPALQQ